MSWRKPRLTEELATLVAPANVPTGVDTRTIPSRASAFSDFRALHLQAALPYASLSLAKGTFLDGSPALPGHLHHPSSGALVHATGHRPDCRYREYRHPPVATRTAACLGTDAGSLAWPDRTDGEPLSRTVQRLKTNAARRVNMNLGRSSQAVWALAFHGHALRKDEELLQAARYIVMNPIRAGLSRRVGDSSCWNCVWL